ncbi:MAG: hypothetical protein NC223_12225, partial [Butyrivibrio sp.]|nr:hypothetical protein [Butyrivibrio sp.]
AESLRAYYPDKRLTFIIGVFADKDYPKMLECVMPKAAKVFAISAPNNPRALSAKTLAEYIKKYYDVKDISVTECASVKEAVAAALLQTEADGAVIAFGSLAHLSLIEEEYRKRIEV